MSIKPSSVSNHHFLTTSYKSMLLYSSTLFRNSYHSRCIAYTKMLLAIIVFLQKFIIQRHFVSNTRQLFCCISHSVAISIILRLNIICRHWKKCCSFFNGKLCKINRNCFDRRLYRFRHRWL